MSTSTPPPVISDPPSALSSLASTLDSYGSDIPSFLNNLLSPHLPASLPSPNPPQPPDLAPIDKTLNELLTQLSLLSQDTNSAVEQSIHDVSRTVPRLAYDLQFMRESANGLCGSLGMVQDRFARQIDLTSSPSTSSGSGSSLLTSTRKDSISANLSNGHSETEGIRTNKSLEKLTHLDKLKNRLESARDILREAESWSTLESELTGFISNAEFSKAGNRLREASRSMVVFQNTPAEYQDRKTLLVSLQNELETSVSKALKNSLDENNVGEIAKFYGVFKDMDRENEFKNYYFNSRSADLLSQWKDTKLVETSTGDTPIIGSNSETGVKVEPTKFSILIHQFYTSLLTGFNAQVEQIPQIFAPHTAASILASFVQTTFDGLDPSPSARLSAVSEYYGSQALPELIVAYRATEELGVAVQSLIDRMTFNTQGGLLSGDIATATSPSSTLVDKTSPGYHLATSPSASGSATAAAPARTPTKKMSISRRFSRAPTISGPLPVDNSWETTLYEPFLDLQSTYATLERRYFEYVLRTDHTLTSSSSTASGKDIARALLDRVTIVFSKADEAIGRCMAFTHGYGALGLLSALEAGLSTFLSNQQKVVMDQIRQAGEISKVKGGRDELDGFDGLDYSTEDWSSFQIVLHILEGCKEISHKLGVFETKLEVFFGSVEVILKAKIPEASQVSTQTQTQVLAQGYDPKTTTAGSITLLQQSTLNSIDLHSLVSTSTTPIQRPILPITSNALREFTRSSQLQIQSIILAPLLGQLETYPHLSVWSKPDKPQRKGELHVPTFSLSPTDVISRVSEGLLDLLRVFEVWSKEQGLKWSIDTLPFIDPSTLPIPISLDIQRTKEGEMGREIGMEIPEEVVLSTWISSLSLTLLSHLTSVTLPGIRQLTGGGASQLATDLGYLSNAVGALDVSWDELDKWEKSIGLDESAWRKEIREARLASTSTSGQDQAQAQAEAQGMLDILRNIGRMRGWN
ncbi:uncharacterized protein I303_101485 [Kwoniella dejecticola CBS 10117]|uniref:Conserved oligomeric Golgi complex subunit 7 n=1 Tax=Kwoniella dejecticola CBS 10117 TaxID=1296121 RepID=A0A1A6ADL5_9TREE|nr:uncharacterized protein I303_02382 [Kwoniella dejecticola CBS 10117]OBR88162.1 hypothetical protein I303_02382 [Kwoniella dejecticola CBS 10117]